MFAQFYFFYRFSLLVSTPLQSSPLRRNRLRSCRLLHQLPPFLLERLRRHLQQLLGHGQHSARSGVGVAGHAFVRGLQAPPADVITAPNARAYGTFDGACVRRRERLAARLRDVPGEGETRGPGERDEVLGVG